MFNDRKTAGQAAKWIIGIFTVCIIIYLSISHLDAIADAVASIFGICEPLIIGAVLAVVLNVPMSAIEKRLFRNAKSIRKKKLRRPLAILLSILLVSGIFVGIAFLVIPELIKAVRLLGQSISAFLDASAQVEEDADLALLPYGEYLARIDVDLLGMKSRLEQWLSNQSGMIADQIMSAVGLIAGGLLSFFIGLIFAIYALARKEVLKLQFTRVIHVWLPRKPGRALLHVLSVCNTTFHEFIVGQVTEAFILGSLCAVGMMLLRIPYAPMIGALVGVTALIPYVGAWLAGIVGAFMILTVSPIKAVIFIIYLVILQQVEGNVIYPKVVGAKIKLPAMWVLAAVTIGGNLAGPVGMLAGVPIASAAYALFREATLVREKEKMMIKSTKSINIK